MSQDNFTSLVGIKWTKNSMLKVHDQMFIYYLYQMLKHPILPDREMIQRIKIAFDWYLHIRGMCLNNEIAFKKKEDKKKI